MLKKALIIMIVLMHDNIFAEQDMTHGLTDAVINAVYQNKMTVDDKLNETFLLKGLSLSPASVNNHASVVMSGANNILLKNRMVKGSDLSPIVGELNSSITMQCVMEGASTLITDASSAKFIKASSACYRRLSNDDLDANAAADSLFSELSNSVMLNHYAKLLWYKLAVKFCAKQSTAGLQAHLEHCPASAARQLFEDVETWWNTNKDGVLNVPFSKQERLDIDRAFCRSSNMNACKTVSIDDATEAVNSIENIFDTIVNKYQENLIAEVTSLIPSKGGNTLTLVERFLSADKLGAQDSRACWAGAKVDNYSVYRQVLQSLDANFPAVKSLAPVLPLTEDVYIAVKDKNSSKIEAITGGDLSGDKYWKDGAANADAYTTAVTFRKDTVAQFKKNQAKYLQDARNAQVVKSTAMANLKYLVDLRMPNSNFSVENEASCPSKQASIQEWMKETAMRRNDPQWAQAVKGGQLADVVKQAVIILAEMRMQEYLNNQVLQRILMTNSVRLLGLSNEDVASNQSSLRSLKKEVDDYVDGGAASQNENTEAAEDALNASGIDPNAPMP